MNGLYFVVNPPVLAADPNRTDIACFVGFIARRARSGGAAQTPAEMVTATGACRALVSRAKAGRRRGGRRLQTLQDLPVPIDTWDVFDRLFAWEARPVDASGRVADTLSRRRRALVFHAGRPQVLRGAGRRPVELPVRYGDRRRGAYGRTRAASFSARCAWRICAAHSRLQPAVADRRSDQRCRSIARSSAARARLAAGARNLARYRRAAGGAGSVVPVRARSLRCAEHGAGFIEQPLPPAPPEQFVECASSNEGIPTRRSGRALNAPRCDEAGFDAWSRALMLVRDFVAQWQREVQIVAAIPLPAPGISIEREIMPRLNAGGLGSAFVQLAYPWVRSKSSPALPGELESPDGVVTGVLARNALAEALSPAPQAPVLINAIDVFPTLSRNDTRFPTGLRTKSAMCRRA
jgi:hypothetical protein